MVIESLPIKILRASCFYLLSVSSMHGLHRVALEKGKTQRGLQDNKKTSKGTSGESTQKDRKTKRHTTPDTRQNAVFKGMR